MNRILSSVLLSTLTLLYACDSSSESEPGRVAGLYAKVMGADAEVVSNEFELNLIASDAGSQNTNAMPATAKLVSPNARIASSPNDYYEQTITNAHALQLTSEAAGCELQPSELETIDGKICWISEKVSVASFANERSLTRMLFFTPDAAYHAMVEATGIQSSVSIAASGFSIGTGCIANPNPDTNSVSVDYLESLLGLSFSTSIMFYDFGITSFFTTDGGLQRGFQLDTGVSFALTLIPFVNFSVSLDEVSSFLLKPTRITRGCENQIADGDETPELFASNSANPFTAIASGLETLSARDGQGYQDLMIRESARSAFNSFSPLASPSSSDISQDSPSATQADLSASFFAHSGSELCASCNDNSIDSFLFRMREGLTAVDGDAQQTQAVAAERFSEYQRSAPGAVPYALAQRYGSNALRLAYLAHEEQSATLRGDSNRYLSAEIVDIEAQVGQPTSISLTKEEIAELVGLPVESLLGATVTVDASPHLEPANFVLANEGLSLEITPANTDSLLVRIDVDLTTALGPLPNDVAEWTVRPAMRRIHPKSGDAAAISLGAPLRSLAGNSLTLTALVTDDKYAPVDSGVMVQFFDGRDRLLGESPVVRGTAQLKVSLEASVPVIANVELRQILQNDIPADGIEISGFEISQDAKVLVDGNSLADTDTAFAILSSKSIVILLEGSGIGPGKHQLQVLNPGSIASTIVPFLVGQQ